VAIDHSSGAHDHDAEQGGDSKPENGRDLHRHYARSPADAQPAEMRGRAEYYETLQDLYRRMVVADKAETTSGTTLTRSAWDIETTRDHPDRPSPDSLRITPERAGHILDGDRWGGGHRHGTGRPGKTEFLSSWDDDKILRHVRDVARSPDAPPVFQPNHRWRLHGQREDVGINVIVLPDGRIWTAWPDADSPGVVKNPRETR
jgi:hypothetical protein